MTAGINDPMNVRKSPIVWKGEVDGPGAFESFATLEEGVRAGMRCVLAAYRLHGRRTVFAILERYAPEADGNPTRAYAAYVAHAAGLASEDSPVDPTEPATLAAVTRAMAWWETHTVLEDALLASAAADALAKDSP